MRLRQLLNKHRLYTATGLVLCGLLSAPAIGQANDELPPPLQPENFSNPTKIDNPWMPLTPGTQLIWEGTTVEDDETKAHRIVFTVTDHVKVIGGIETVVCYDRDDSEGELEEAELIFFAQDDVGNVWHLGEYPEEYEDGEITDTPGWIHGVDGALAGIMMQADPQEGTPSYAQGWGPGVGWNDRGQTYKMGETKNVPHANYDDVLIISETSASEPDAAQLKFYARGVGNIAVGYMGNDASQEVLELVVVNQLSPHEQKRFSKTVFEHEKRGYTLYAEVYGATEPIIGHDVAAIRGKLQLSKEPVRKISDDQAIEIASAALPGEVMDLKIERKMGAKRLIVEVIAEKDSKEWDVIIDMESGDVLRIAD